MALYGTQHVQDARQRGLRVARRKPADTPDAFIWTDDNGHAAMLCADCAVVRHVDSESVLTAWRIAASHLWSVHSKRRAWIEWADPTHTAAVQIALPIVLASNTTRHG